MDKRNGHPPRTTVIPQIIVTDYDAEISNQPRSKADTKETNECDHAIDTSTSSPNASVLNESEEEDREIIDSLTKAHSINSEHHIDVDEMGASNVVKSETTNETALPQTSIEYNKTEMTEKLAEKKELPTDILTDDIMADREVSRLTTFLESKKKFVPLPSSILNLQRPTASFVPVPPPPGALPDISDLNLPRRVPKIESNSTDVADLLLSGGNFQPLSEMSFSVESRFNRSECLPTNGGNQVRNRRTEREFGESDDSGSQYSSSNSLDEHPPQYWKLQESAGKSDSGGSGISNDDINQILDTFHVVEDCTVDDNAPSTSENLRKLNALSKQYEGENKK